MNFHSLKKNSAVLMSVIIIAKLVGILRDIVLANHYGTSNVSDAYLIAVSIPTLLFYFIGHALSTAYLPMFKKIKAEKGELAAQKYSNNLTNISLAICTAIVLLLLCFPETIVRVFAAGFDAETVSIAARFVRISCCSVYFMTLVSTWGGYLHANSNFIIPASISLPRNLAIVVSIVVSAHFGIEFLGIGLLVAYVLEFLLLVPFAVRAGYRPSLYINLKDPAMRETLYVVLPILLGVGVSQINKIVDRSLASLVSEGALSALSYASIINNAVQEVLVTGIITILFANCATYVAEGKTDEVKKVTSKTMEFMLFLLIPGTVGIVLLAELIVSCVLQRGNFDGDSLRMTVGALRCYAIGLSFLAVRDMLVKVFYAYKETKITTATSIMAILLNIGLNFLLSYFWGINGLALATSLSAVFQCVILYILLRRRIGDFGLKRTLLVLAGILASSAVMAALVLLFRHWLSSSELMETVKLVLLVAIGMIAYALAALAFHLPQATAVAKKIFKRKGV